MVKKDSMEPVYHCDSVELDKLLKEKGIEINDLLYKKIIYKKYCFHIIKGKNGIMYSCNRYRKHGNFCEKHYIKRCFSCNNPIKIKDSYCYLH